MYLVSEKAQRVTIDSLALEVGFHAGEAIHTENSYKYSLDELAALASDARLRIDRQWLDADRRFSLNLFAPGSPPPTGTPGAAGASSGSLGRAPTRRKPTT